MAVYLGFATDAWHMRGHQHAGVAMFARMFAHIHTYACYIQQDVREDAFACSGIARLSINGKPPCQLVCCRSPSRISGEEKEREREMERWRDGEVER